MILHRTTEMVMSLASVGLLCSASSEANAQSGGAPVNAATCVSSTQDDSMDYPYSVDSVIEAYMLAFNEVQPNGRVARILVIDNGFAAYRTHEYGNPITRRALRYGKAFERSYFMEKNPHGEPSTGLLDWSSSLEEYQSWLHGHGTHVTGLVLGGAYGANPKSSSQSFIRPRIRTVHRPYSSSDARTNVRVFVHSISNSNWETPNGKLGQAIWDPIRDLDPTDLRYPNVVNLSIAQRASSGELLANIPGPRDNIFGHESPIVVGAVGNGSGPSNNGIRLKRNSLWFPAQAADDSGVLLGVASHDADGSRSHFSNYGSEFAKIAAPGCKIRSWLGSSDEVTPLSGTSFATAITSFAASLIHTIYGGGGASIRQRLELSSRFEPKLLSCDGESMKWSHRDRVSRTFGCVRYGSRLDIPTSLLGFTDFIEYCDEDDQNLLSGASGGSAKPPAEVGIIGCMSPKRVVGILRGSPELINQCAKHFGDEEPIIRGSDVTPNIALRRINKSQFQYLYVEHGNNEIKAGICDISELEDGGFFSFEIHRRLGKYSEKQQTKPNSGLAEPIKVNNIVRMVTRSQSRKYN